MGRTLFSAACYRQPASLTVPGYAEKMAKKQKAEHTPLGKDENAPTYFPEAEKK